jgi:hypothetical protein
MIHQLPSSQQNNSRSHNVVFSFSEKYPTPKQNIFQSSTFNGASAVATSLSAHEGNVGTVHGLGKLEVAQLVKKLSAFLCLFKVAQIIQRRMI